MIKSARFKNTCPHRLAAQDEALSRLKLGFESPWGHNRVTARWLLPFKLAFALGDVIRVPNTKTETCRLHVSVSACTWTKLGIQMVCVIRVLTGIATGDVHLTRGQVDHQGRDRVLPVEWVDPIDVVVANGIRQVDMILLNRLQRLDVMSRVLPQ